jgi:hypothetical protein
MMATTPSGANVPYHQSDAEAVREFTGEPRIPISLQVCPLASHLCLYLFVLQPFSRCGSANAEFADPYDSRGGRLHRKECVTCGAGLYAQQLHEQYADIAFPLHTGSLHLPLPFDLSAVILDEVMELLATVHEPAVAKQRLKDFIDSSKV